jgi:hypothetical protein
LEEYGRQEPSRAFEDPESMPIPRGFPQGANISPFLSICLLNLLNGPAFGNILMYADDGLIYSSKKFDASEVSRMFEGIGIEVSPEKSG